MTGAESDYSFARHCACEIDALEYEARLRGYRCDAPTG